MTEDEAFKVLLRIKFEKGWFNKDLGKALGLTGLWIGAILQKRTRISTNVKNRIEWFLEKEKQEQKAKEG